MIFPFSNFLTKVEKIVDCSVMLYVRFIPLCKDAHQQTHHLKDFKEIFMASMHFFEKNFNKHLTNKYFVLLLQCISSLI